MDEDEMTRTIQAQLEAEEGFGLSSYASFQVPVASNQGGPNAKTAKAIQQSIYEDSDDEEEEDGEYTEETATSSNHSDPISSPRSGVPPSSSTSLPSPGSTPPGRSALATPFGAFTRPSAPRAAPLISVARANSVSKPPPFLPLIPGQSPPQSGSSSPHEKDSNSASPPTAADGTPANSSHASNHHTDEQTTGNEQEPGNDDEGPEEESDESDESDSEKGSSAAPPSLPKLPLPPPPLSSSTSTTATSTVSSTPPSLPPTIPPPGPTPGTAKTNPVPPTAAKTTSPAPAKKLPLFSLPPPSLAPPPLAINLPPPSLAPPPLAIVKQPPPSSETSSQALPAPVKTSPSPRDAQTSPRSAQESESPRSNPSSPRDDPPPSLAPVPAGLPPPLSSNASLSPPASQPVVLPPKANSTPPVANSEKLPKKAGATSANSSPKKSSSSSLSRKTAGKSVTMMSIGGELYLKGANFPNPGQWMLAECLLTGNQLTWKSTDHPEVSGTLDLATFTKLLKSKTVDPLLPAGIVSYVMSSQFSKILWAATEPEMTLVWRDAINLARGAPTKPSTKKSKKAVSGGDGGAMAVAAINTIKTRMENLASITSTATFNLLRLFFLGKYTFIKAIFQVIQITEADKLATGLARMFFYADMPLRLIKSVIDLEVSKTEGVNQLFRQDSIASKIMSSYTRLIAQPYLIATLKESVTKIAQSGGELEINPDMLKPEEREHIPARSFLLQANITELLESIRDSVRLVPTECRIICSFLNSAVVEKFGDQKAAEIAVAGYLFLRFINSAIIFPDTIGIIDKTNLSPAGRRSLTLVSKVILNMANQLQFSKEPYLLPFNEYLTDKFPILQEFIRNCSDVPADCVLTATNVPPPQMILDELAVIYKILYPLQDKIAAALEHDPRILKRFKSAFQMIGPPPSPASQEAPTKDKKDKKDKNKEPEKKIPLPPELHHFVSKSLVH